MAVNVCMSFWEISVNLKISARRWSFAWIHCGFIFGRLDVDDDDNNDDDNDGEYGSL